MTQWLLSKNTNISLLIYRRERGTISLYSNTSGLSKNQSKVLKLLSKLSKIISHKIIGLRLKVAFLPYFYQDNCFV